MSSKTVLFLLGHALLLATVVNGACYDPSPAFLPPSLVASDPILQSAFATVQKNIDAFSQDKAFNSTSFSVEVTSLDSTLWSYHHTARELNSSRPGADPVTDNSFYRIASITKTFTTLAILKQAAAGNLSLDDPVDKYLSNLTGAIPWKDITLRTLASQLSGIPRDWSQADLLMGVSDPTDFGLPPPNNPHLPPCYNYSEGIIPCNATDLYHAMSYSRPVFAPNQKSTYSNTAFELLGLVLANVTSLPYETAIETLILNPLNISTSTGATFLPPPDPLSVLPSGIQYYHDVHQGVHNPTGGLFMTTSAMSKFLRSILSSFNSPSLISLQTGNWLSPHSFTASTTSFYGMPWEIFRPDNLLTTTRRPVSFYTKSGGVPGYTTIIILAPEYNLAFSIFVAGNGELLNNLRETVTVTLIRAVEDIVTQQVTHRYTGSYTYASQLSPTTPSPQTNYPTLLPTEEKLNSSLTLTYTPETGLSIAHWISNSTDPIAKFAATWPNILPPGSRAQLVPTGLYVDEHTKSGERWKVLVVPQRHDSAEEGEAVWEDFCVTDVDFIYYDGRPFNEVVFWGSDAEGVGRVGEVDFIAFRVRLAREDGEGIEVVVQE